MTLKLGGTGRPSSVNQVLRVRRGRNNRSSCGLVHYLRASPDAWIRRRSNHGIDELIRVARIRWPNLGGRRQYSHRDREARFSHCDLLRNRLRFRQRGTSFTVCRIWGGCCLGLGAMPDPFDFRRMWSGGMRYRTLRFRRSKRAGKRVIRDVFIPPRFQRKILGPNSGQARHRCNYRDVQNNRLQEPSPRHARVDRDVVPIRLLDG